MANGVFALVKDRLSVASAASAMVAIVPVIRNRLGVRDTEPGRAAGMPLVEIFAG